MRINDSDTHIFEILKNDWWDHFVSDDDLIYKKTLDLTRPARDASEICVILFTRKRPYSLVFEHPLSNI